METIRAVVAGTPLAWCIVGAGLLALGAQAWLLREAGKRRTLQRRLRLAAELAEWEAVGRAAVPRPHLEILALAALLMVPAAAVVSVELSRAAVSASFAEADPAVRARLLSDGWKAQLNGISLGIALEELAGGLAVIAWSFAFAARRQIAGLVHGATIATLDPRGAAAQARFPSPETETVMACAGSVAALALLPALHGAFSYCVLVTKRLSLLGDVARPDKLRQIDAVLIEARRALEAGISASQLGLVLAAVTCCGFLWWRSPERARRQWLGRPERDVAERAGSRGEVAWGTVACVLASLSLYLVSRPLKAENEMPWPNLEPPADQHAARLLSGVKTPDLVGPDRIPRAPILELTPTALRLDGEELDASASRVRFDALRAGGLNLDAGAVPPEELIVACEADTPARLLAPVLAAAQASGFRRPVFVFTNRETVRRPALGTFTRTRSTAATTLFDDGVAAAGATVLRPADFGICADLAARIVKLRRDGASVGLAVAES